MIRKLNTASIFIFLTIIFANIMGLFLFSRIMYFSHLIALIISISITVYIYKKFPKFLEKKGLLILGSIIVIFIFLNSLYVIPLIYSSKQDEQKAKIASDIIKHSGIKKQTLSLLDIIKQQASASEHKLNKYSTNEKKLFIKICQDEFHPEHILKETKYEIKNSFSEADLTSLLIFFKQELVLKLTSLEDSASTAEGIIGMQNYAKEIEKNPPSQPRISLITELDKALQLTDFSVDMIMRTMKGIALSLDGNKTNDQAFQQIKSQLAPQIRYGILVSLLYTYKSVSDKDLRWYTNEYKSNKLLKKLSEIYIQAIHHGFLEWGKNIGKRIKLELPRKTKK